MDNFGFVEEVYKLMQRHYGLMLAPFNIARTRPPVGGEPPPGWVGTLPTWAITLVDEDKPDNEWLYCCSAQFASDHVNVGSIWKSSHADLVNRAPCILYSDPEMLRKMVEEILMSSVACVTAHENMMGDVNKELEAHHSNWGMMQNVKLLYKQLNTQFRKQIPDQ
jgi:hypothetical protein